MSQAEIELREDEWPMGLYLLCPSSSVQNSQYLRVVANGKIDISFVNRQCNLFIYLPLHFTRFETPNVSAWKFTKLLQNKTENLFVYFQYFFYLYLIDKNEMNIIVANFWHFCCLLFISIHNNYSQTEECVIKFTIYFVCGSL